MNKARTILFILLAMFSAAFADAQLVAPTETSHAAAIHYRIENAEPGDSVRWLLLNPFPAGNMTQIVSQSGTDLIVDPPQGFSGVVRIQVLVTGSDGVLKFVEVGQTLVKPSENAKPEPKPVPKPDVTGEYTGPNKHGIGKVSFDSAPKYSDEVASLIRDAAGYVKGYPTLKVIGTPDSSIVGEDYILFVWLNKEMLKHSEFGGWYRDCIEHMHANGMETGTSTDKWYLYLVEMAQGLEARE
jgi:hypothetical protein